MAEFWGQAPDYEKAKVRMTSMEPYILEQRWSSFQRAISHSQFDSSNT